MKEITVELTLKFKGHNSSETFDHFRSAMESLDVCAYGELLNFNITTTEAPGPSSQGAEKATPAIPKATTIPILAPIGHE